MNSTQHTKVSLATMPLRGANYWIVAVSSMEQIIGAGLSTVVGIMIPLMMLTGQFHLSSLLQGLIGATGLVGIGIGSAIIGRLSDRQGYLGWFRACPVMIIIGAMVCYFLPTIPGLFIGLSIIGIGVGGGYSLDSTYISELMPDKWRLIMVGVAKATSALGFVGVAAICFFIVHDDPNPELWRSLILIIGILGLITLLMRLRWAESPLWLMAHGMPKKAHAATRRLLGDDVTIDPETTEREQSESSTTANYDMMSMFKGENLKRVIFSGIPWACEGLGVYGFGVFLPVLVIALGIESASDSGMHKVISSIEITAVVNFFILVGFVAGLFIFNRYNHVKMLSWGFIGSALGLGLILVGYMLKLPVWIMVLGFVIFEFALNIGPHLITFIIPAAVYPIADRSTGTGIASLLGKVGAVIGVILMPILLNLGGMTLVLVVSIAVMLLGALISIIYGRQLKLM